MNGMLCEVADLESQGYSKYSSWTDSGVLMFRARDELNTEAESVKKRS